MKKKSQSLLFALCSLRFARSAQAQQAGKIFRIGFLDRSTASGSAVLLEAFRQELSKLGWIEGKNIAIEYRFAEQKRERLPELAAELVRLKVDVIVAGRFRADDVPLRKRLLRFPSSWRSDADPVASGWSPVWRGREAMSLDCRLYRPELNTKRLEILKDAFPSSPELDFCGPRQAALTANLQLKELRPAASALKLKLEEIETQVDAKGLETAFQTAKQKQVDAIMTTVQSAPFSAKESGSSNSP